MSSLYDRLDRHTSAQTDGAGPIRGTLTAPRIGMIWLAANLVVTTLLTGTLFIPAVTFGTAITMIVIGTVIGAIVLVSVGTIGTRTGLPTMALTRGSFGVNGSLLPVCANVVVLMGWSWVQAMLAGLTVDYLVADLTGFSSPILFAVLCQTIVVGLAILGHEGIARVEPWLAVVMLLIIAWVFVTAFTTFEPGAYQAIPVDESLGYTPVIVLDIVIATAMSWTVLSADFNRFAQSPRAGIIGSGIGYCLSTIISMSLGATIIGYILLSGDEAIAFDPGVLVGAFGAPLAIVIFVSVMATNSMVVYGMVTSVVNARVGGRLKFLPTALVLGVISILGATWFGLLAQFTDFLVMIGALFVPVFAIMIVDYYVIKRGSYARDILRARSGKYWYTKGINPRAVGVWLIGAVMSYVWTYVWPLPIGATIPAFALSALLYLVVMLPLRVQPTEQAAGHLAPEAGAAT